MFVTIKYIGSQVQNFTYYTLEVMKKWVISSLKIEWFCHSGPKFVTLFTNNLGYYDSQEEKKNYYKNVQ